MRITSIRIENFRSIKSLYVELGETTVFIGPNNGGKTAILDAIRIALTRRWGQRGTGFTEYDVHLAREGDDPKTSSGVAIELRAEESAPGEWPDEVHQALEDIVQDDPVTGRSSVTLRVNCAWVPRTDVFSLRGRSSMRQGNRLWGLRRAALILSDSGSTSRSFILAPSETLTTNSPRGHNFGAVF
jgi:AAA ATPase domain